MVAVEAEKLRVNWVTLYNSNSGSKDDQIDLETFDPTFQGVRDLIISVTETLEAKRKTGASGRITSGFHSFCDKLDSHAAFLKMLPDGNEYVSVFTGSLSAIIKVRVCPNKALNLANCVGERQPRSGGRRTCRGAL